MALGSVTVGLALAGLLRPVAGLQLYVKPAKGLAPSCPMLPEQMIIAAPGAATGSGSTVTVTALVLTQLLALVTVSVYV